MTALLADEVRRIVGEQGGLRVDVMELSETTDLFVAGMTSHASVNVMLGLEDAFDVEFPDRMLEARGVREHRGALASDRRTAGGGVSPACPDEVCPVAARRPGPR